MVVSEKNISSLILLPRFHDGGISCWGNKLRNTIAKSNMGCYTAQHAVKTFLVATCC